MALARLSQLEESHSAADPYTRVLNPKRRAQLLAEADAGLSAMQRGFGFDHMLVRKMQKLYERILQPRGA